MGQDGLRWKFDDAVLLALASMGALGIFVLDLLTPLGYAVWIGYSLPVWVISRLSMKTTVLLPATALACTGLIAAGYVLSPPGLLPIMSVVNRTMGAGFLWIMTGALMRAGAIDDRLRAALEHLQLSEARYRELIQALPAAVYTCDERGRITLYNQAAAVLWGREPEIGKDLWCGSWKIYRPDGTPLPLEDCPMALTLRESRAVSGEEIVIERPDGTRRHVLPHPEPMRNAAGAIVGAVNMLVDVTDRKRAGEALRLSEERYRTLFETAPMALFVCDRNAVIQHYNRRAVELWGREPTCGVERHCGSVKLWLPDNTLLPHALSPMVEVLRTGMPALNIEVSIERPDGSRVPVLVNFAALKSAQGEITGAITSFIDITDRKQAEEALRQRDQALTAANDALKDQTAALAESNKELEGFSYSVSHDLRAPLRTIDAFSRIVEEEHGPQLNAEAQRCLTVVRKAAAQAGELIDDLLEFSRLGRQGMNIRSVKMTDLAREAVDDMTIMQEGRKIDLLVADLPSCRGDRRLLKLVWANLLTNAFKYTKHRDEARVEVGWMPDDASAEAVTYYVKDNGVGFDMKYAHKLFNVFQRLHRTEEFEGTGVGLAIVQRIVQRHGGRVWADGKVEGGATFFFSLRKAAP